MRLSCVLLSLFALLAAAERQNPLSEKAAGWLDKVKSYIPSGTASPVDAGASVVAEKQVERINNHNWERKLAPSPDGPIEWMILISGGNSSCYGRCEPVDAAWNRSVPLLSAGPSAPRLGRVDCDAEPVLCSTWQCAAPTLWHIQVPQATRGAANTPTGQASGPTRLHIVSINATTIEPQDFVKMHSDKTYLKVNEYTGPLHPIDGWVAKMGLLKPFGYILWGFNAIPSWTFMIVISFFSRNIMAKRMSRGGAPPPRAEPKKD